MVSQEDWLVLPSRDTVIWRYMETWKFTEMIKNGGLWFHRGDKFRDTIEGTVPTRDARLIASEVTRLGSPSLAGWVAALGACLRRNTLVNCWHMDAVESSSMWTEYVPSGNGVVIKSTVGQLIDSFSTEDSRLICLGEVFYVDHRTYHMPSVGTSGLDWRLPTGPYLEARGGYRPLLYKQLSFAEERELRAMFARIPLDTNGSPAFDVQLWRKGDYVGADLHTLIGEIRTAPHLPAQETHHIADVLSAAHLTVPLGVSEMG